MGDVGGRSCPLRGRRDKFRAAHWGLPYLCPCEVSDVTGRELSRLLFADLVRDDPEWVGAFGRLLGLFPSDRA
jgi:hypothetical protein